MLHYYGWNGPTGDARMRTENERRVYYLLSGRTIENAPIPWTARRQGGGLFGSRWSEEEFAYRNEQGGETVGRQVNGLSLAASRLEGVLDGHSETATTDWTLEFRNTTTEAQEARAEILLPPGGVVDKVSLWINGEERPAAFGAKKQVRAAYQEVADFAGPLPRDPLLVTATDPGHVFAQCFPVPPGGQMKIKLGVSAPLVWQNVCDPRLIFAAPRFSEANFSLPADLRCQMFLRARNTGTNAAAAAAWQAAQTQGWRLGTEVGAGDGNRSPTRTAYLEAPAAPALLGGNMPALVLAGPRDPRPGDWLDGSLARRDSPFPAPARPVDLLLVVDSARGMEVARNKSALDQLTGALSALPAGSRVRWVDARHEQVGARSPWLPAAAALHRGEGENWWRARRFVGGVDAAPALAWAVNQAKQDRSGRPAAVVWLHGATPAGVSDAKPLQRRLLQ